MLILLAFFVFLHSRSEFAERKVAPILDSLALRFAAAGPWQGAADAAAVAWRGEPVRQLRRRLLGHLPVSAAIVEVPGALVAFDLAAAALFAADDEAVARDRLVLLHRLAAAVAASGTTLAVITAWPDDAADLAASTAQFSALLASFDATPLPVAQLRFGFADLPAGSWRFVVREEIPDAT